MKCPSCGAWICHNCGAEMAQVNSDIGVCFKCQIRRRKLAESLAK